MRTALAAGILVLIAVAAGGESRLSAASERGCQREFDRATPDWVRRQRAMVVVDSVLLSGYPALRKRIACFRPERFGRPAFMIRFATQGIRARRRVAPLVVIGVGYNSLFQRDRRRYRYWAERWDREARGLLWALRRRGARQFVWVTLRQPTRRTVPPRSRGRELSQYSWYFPYVNERLRILDRERDDLVLADWRTAGDRPGVTYDTIHLNARGGELMAGTIREAIWDEARRQKALSGGP